MAERTFYHLTTNRNLASILHSGLQPRRGPRSRQYWKGEKRQAVYFFLEMWDALRALDDMYGDEFGEEMVLLRVRLDEEAITIEEDENQAITMQVVAPEQIEVVARGLLGESWLQEQHDLRTQVQLSRLQYHVTPSRNLKKIAREGLRARRGARSVKLGEGKGIFLFTTRMAATEAAGNWLGDEFAEGTKLALLQVLVPEGVEILFDPAVGYESRIEGDVNAEYVQVVNADF
jgi:RNA:NAD 2'-phosphotransferase (TPT1/KptA family)